MVAFFLIRSVLQKRAIRIIDKQAFRAHTTPIFKELRILKLEDIYSFNLGKLIYQLKNNLHPNCLECKIQLVKLTIITLEIRKQFTYRFVKPILVNFLSIIRVQDFLIR